MPYLKGKGWLLLLLLLLFLLTFYAAAGRSNGYSRTAHCFQPFARTNIDIDSAVVLANIERDKPMTWIY